MPRYMILRRSWLPQEPGGPLRLLEAGEVIEFLGIPGNSMVAMDGEAAARIAAARPSSAYGGPRTAKAIADRLRRHGVANLTRSKKAQLAAAQASFGGSDA